MGKKVINAQGEKYLEQGSDQGIKGLTFSWRDGLISLGISVITILLTRLLNQIASDPQNAMLLYILSVLIISRITTGYIYGVGASIIYVLTFNYLFTEPRFSFIAIDSGYPLTFLIMLVVALITSTLTVRIKGEAQRAQERERRIAVLYEINQKLLSASNLSEIIEITNGALSTLLKRSVIFYTKGLNQGEVGTPKVYPGDLEEEALRAEVQVARWVLTTQQAAGAGTPIPMKAKCYYLPVVSQGKALGVVGISFHQGPLNSNGKNFIQMVATQAAMALARQYLLDQQHQILLEAEGEKLRGNLLRAISHDLRTPLTGILGASSVLAENADSLDQATQRKLALDIKQDSQWLIRMVENLLSVTRINHKTMEVSKSPEVVEEILAEAISRIRSRFPTRTIHVKVPEEFLMVPMDAMLIEQVVINLVENAIKNSLEKFPVEVEVWRREEQAIFEVRDYGEGIPEEELPHLFENRGFYQHKSVDASTGMGIGLSICMSIIKAHHGTLEAMNLPRGGAVFRFTLPLKEATENE